MDFSKRKPLTSLKRSWASEPQEWCKVLKNKGTVQDARLLRWTRQKQGGEELPLTQGQG